MSAAASNCSPRARDDANDSLFRGSIKELQKELVHLEERDDVRHQVSPFYCDSRSSREVLCVSVPPDLEELTSRSSERIRAPS